MAKAERVAVRTANNLQELAGQVAELTQRVGAIEEAIQGLPADIAQQLKDGLMLKSDLVEATQIEPAPLKKAVKSGTNG